MSVPDYSFEKQVKDIEKAFRDDIRNILRKDYGMEGTEPEIDTYIKEHDEELNAELKSMFSGMFYGPTLGQ